MTIISSTEHSGLEHLSPYNPNTGTNQKFVYNQNADSMWKLTETFYTYY